MAMERTKQKPTSFPLRVKSALAATVVLSCLLITAGDVLGITFKQLRLPLPYALDDMAVVDMNGDGYSDLIAILNDLDQIRVFLGDAKQTFAKQVIKKVGNLKGRFVGVADFNGDGKLDVAVDEYASTDYFLIFPGNGKGGLLSPKRVPAAGGEPRLSSPVVLDFDGDGLPDLAATLGWSDYSKKRSLTVFHNLGGYKFTPLVVRYFDYSVIVAGDFNGDDRDDLLVLDRGEYFKEDDRVFFFKSKGDGTFAAPLATKVGDSSGILKAGDLNGDGKLDLFSSDFGISGKYYPAWIMPGKGNGQFLPRQNLPDSGGLKELDSVVLADLTADKKLDVVSVEETGVDIYAGNGNGTVKPSFRLGPNLQFYWAAVGRNVGAGDFNKDRKTDLATVQVDLRYKPNFQNILLFLAGKPAATTTISELVITKSTYSLGRINLAGSFSFQSSAGDVRFKTSLGDSAFLEFTVWLDLPPSYSDRIETWRVTGPWLNLPGVTSGTVAFDLNLTSGLFTMQPVIVSAYGFYLWDSNLVMSNKLSPTAARRGSGLRLY
jgi:hypothetical protein